MIQIPLIQIGAAEGYVIVNGQQVEKILLEPERSLTEEEAATVVNVEFDGDFAYYFQEGD
jgi:hypothetical protein